MSTLLWPASGNVAISGGGFTDPEKAYVQDDDPATATANPTESHYTFDNVTSADIPDDSTINSVTLQLRQRQDDGSSNQYGWNGIDFGGGNSGGYGVVGTDIGAATLADLRALSSFGYAAVKKANADGTDNLDAIWLEIDFTAPEPAPEPSRNDGMAARRRMFLRKRRDDELDAFYAEQAKKKGRKR